MSLKVEIKKGSLLDNIPDRDDALMRMRKRRRIRRKRRKRRRKYLADGMVFSSDKFCYCASYNPMFFPKIQ
jgi:hypothetical protein